MSKLIIVFFIICVATLSLAMSCQSCGVECVSACGTRYFRTCCFNYLRRKRGSHFEIYSNPRNKIPHVFQDLDTGNQEFVELFDNYV